MGCRKVQALGPLVAAAVVVASVGAEAAWWKGLNWSKDGSLNNDYWDGFGISYEDWYATGGHSSINSSTWENVEAVFEVKDTRFFVNLDDDFVCRNVTAFQGATGGQMTMDLRGHDFATLSGSWGFFFKGNNGDIVISNGTVSVKKGLNVGDSNGCSNTLTVVNATVAYPESVAVGREASTGNTLVVDLGGRILLSNTDGVHGNWGLVVGERSAECDNTLIVRNGGVITNTASTLFVGQDGNGNSLRVESAGYVYREGYMHLANASSGSGAAPSGNSIVIDGAGSEFFVNSHFLVGNGVDMQFKNLGNKVKVSNGGFLHVHNDFLMRSSGNEVVVSNGTIRIDEGGLRLAPEIGGVTSNKLTVAGTSPWIRTSYDFTALNGATLKFIVPAGGYVAPAGFDALNESFGDLKSADGGITYVPVTAGVFLTIGADTTLEVDALEFSKSIQHTTTIPLIRGCGYGNDSSVTPEMIAAWNENLPDGCTVSMMGDKYTSSDWGQKTLMLTVKPYNNGMRVMIR